jgi:beta-lactamase superfamily II metal-dependent hydrolase
MLFTLEALDARKGDSLLLHFGAPAQPTLIVIDGGPAGVYNRRLRPRLEQLRARRTPDAALPIRMVMVSHLDDDHINGVLAMLNEIDDLRAGKKPQPYDVLTLWHNSFDDILGNETDLLTANLKTAATAASSDTAIPADLPIHRDAALVLASVGQGRDLRARAKSLSVVVNEQFATLVAVPDGQPGKSVDIAPGLSFTVLGPSQARVVALREEWDKQIKKLDVARQAGFVDDSVFNLSSIIVIARAGEQTMLLTGDARGDDILAGLKGANLMAGGRCHVNILKVPHHGSDRNVSREFFQQVTADAYVISGNGQHGNPEVAMLQMLSDARAGDDNFAVHLTNSEPRLTAFFDSEKDKGRKYEVVFRDPAAPSLKIELGDALQD